MNSIKINLLKIKYYMFFNLIFCLFCFKCNENNVNEKFFFKNDESGININTDSFKKEILQKKGISMLYIYKETCPYCQDFKKVFKKISREYGEKISIFALKLDEDKNKRKIQVQKLNSIDPDMDLNSVPWIILYKDGKHIENIDENGRTKQNLEQKINKLLNT